MVNKNKTSTVTRLKINITYPPFNRWRNLVSSVWTTEIQNALKTSANQDDRNARLSYPPAS